MTKPPQLTWYDQTALAKAFSDLGASIDAAGDSFGSGADGALDFDGIATVAGLDPVANVYTLIADLDATTLAVEAGITVETAGFRLRATNAVTNAGTITSS